MLTDWALRNLREKVISFVVGEDESGEIFYANLPDCFHSKFWEVNHFLGFDVLLGEKGCGSSCGT